jgi:hypothetical protein
MAATTVTTETVNAAANLKAACDEAFAKHNISCSHAVWYVLTKLIDTNFKWLDANHLIDFLVASPDWKEVTVDNGSALALKGTIVIGGLKDAGGHGHVIVIYPGPKKASGGYTYTIKTKRPTRW